MRTFPWEEDERERWRVGGLSLRRIVDALREHLLESGCGGEAGRGEKIKLPRVANDSLDLRRKGHNSFSGLS